MGCATAGLSSSADTGDDIVARFVRHSLTYDTFDFAPRAQESS